MLKRLEQCKQAFQKGLKILQGLIDRQVDFLARHLPELPRCSQKIYLTWPNLISLTRIPFVEFLAWRHDQPLTAIVILLVAAYTDLFDGLLARKTGQTSLSGAIIDPTCDKYLAIRCLIIYRLSLWPYLAWASIVTDCSIFAVPMLAAAAKLIDPTKVDFKSTIVGKTKFFLQCVGIGAVVFGWCIIANVLLSMALAIALWSIGDKIWESLPALRRQKAFTATKN